MNRWRRVTGLISLLMCVVPLGCVPSAQSVPKFSDTEAKLFAPQAGLANIYVYRTQTYTASAFLAAVQLDELPAGLLGVKDYVLLTVNPGIHKLMVSWSGSITINADAAKNYFVLASPKTWTAKKKEWDLRITDEQTGREAVGNSRGVISQIEYEPPMVNDPTQAEKVFEFILRAEPRPARILIERGGIQQELGTTPYSFRVGLAARYKYYPVRKGAMTDRQSVGRPAYVMYPQDSPLITVREIHSMDIPPALELKCKLVADGFDPQLVERAITFKKPADVTNPESWLPDGERIVVGLSRPTRPEYVVNVKIDSIPTGADIYAFGTEGYLGGKLGTTPAEFTVGFANGRSPDTGAADPTGWSVWPPTKEAGFVTWLSDTRLTAGLNFVLLKDGYARQDITRWTLHTPDVNTIKDTQKTITIPLKTHEQARQERLDRIEEARTQLAAALERTKLELRQAEISNQQQLIRQQELISNYLAQLSAASDRVSNSSPGTITVRQDPHYNREWQDSMAALGSILRPYSKVSPVEREERIQGLEGLGTLIDLMNR